MIEPKHPRLSVALQCELISIGRSAFYGPVQGNSALNLERMRLIDAQFLEMPWYGRRQMARHLRRLDHEVGRKRVAFGLAQARRPPPKPLFRRS
jgi:putative transposase